MIVVLAQSDVEASHFRKCVLPLQVKAVVVTVCRGDGNIEIAVYACAAFRTTSEHSHISNIGIVLCPIADRVELFPADTEPSLCWATHCLLPPGFHAAQ